MVRQLVVLLLFGASTGVRADAELQGFLESTLAQSKGEVPAVAALIQVRGSIEAQAAFGVRSANATVPVTLADRWHIGSDTKAMTATMIARLAERGVLSLDGTMPEFFPGLASRMDPAYREVTLIELLSHRSGLAGFSEEGELETLHAVIGPEKNVRAQRAALALRYLTRPPDNKRGEFKYSNLGYIVAAAVAEASTGRSWEELILREVWKPLGIRHAGFGPPARKGKYDQPWPHEFVGKLVQPLDAASPRSELPAVIGPAGLVNISLQDWLLFAQDQLDGLHGHGKLLNAESYRRLHTPFLEKYALGWGVMHDKDGAVSMLTHMGSNGYWMANIRIMPKHDIIVLIAMNGGGERAEKTMRDIGKALHERLKPLD